MRAKSASFSIRYLMRLPNRSLRRHHPKFCIRTALSTLRVKKRTCARQPHAPISLRRAERALACCAPFRRQGHAMGGSGRNTPPVLPQQKGKACFLLAEKAGLNLKQSNPQHLEKVLTGRSISVRKLHIASYESNSTNSIPAGAPRRCSVSAPLQVK